MSIFQDGRGIIVTTQGVGNLHLLSYEGSRRSSGHVGRVHTMNRGTTCFMISNGGVFENFAFYWDGAGEATYTIGIDHQRSPVGSTWRAASAVSFGDCRVSTADVSSFSTSAIRKDTFNCSVISGGSAFTQREPTQVARLPACGISNTADFPPADRKTVPLYEHYDVPPQIAVGFNHVDLHSSVAGVEPSISHITKTDFVLDVREHNRNNWKMYSVGMSWLAIAANHPDFQTGVQTNMSPKSSYIKFKKAYAKPPNVVCFLNKLSLTTRGDYGVKAYTTDVDATGFYLHIDKWSDSAIVNAGVAWVAYPADQKKVVSGTISTVGGPPGNNHSGIIHFGEGTFDRIPSVFMAISYMDVDRKANLRLKAFFDNVDMTRMTWHIGSWGDSVLYGAKASYICIG